MANQTMDELLAELDPNGEHVYTRERFDQDHARLLKRLCEKHGVSTVEQIDDIISRHAYVHTAEDPEDEWMEIHALARAAGWQC